MNDISSLIDHTVLVGLTYYDTHGEMTRQEQFKADITGIKKDSLVVITPDKKERLLPPAYIHRAPRGEYKCLTSGERVTDPDFLSAWLIKESSESDVPPSLAPDSATLSSPLAPRHWDFTLRHDPNYLKWVIDAERRNYLGRHVLVGLTYYMGEGSVEEFVEQKQIHGEIVRISYNEGIVIELDNGDEFILPPELPMLEPAPPGVYNLRSTSKTLVDPDFITTWIVHEPPSEQ